MRPLLCLLFVIGTTAFAQELREEPLATRVPATSLVYVQLEGMTPKTEAFLESRLGTALAAHPLAKTLQGQYEKNPELGWLRNLTLALKDSTRMDLPALARAVGSKQIVFSVHPPRDGSKEPTYLVLLRVDPDATRKVLFALPAIILKRPQPVLPANEHRPAVLGYGKKVFYYQQDSLLVISSDAELAGGAAAAPNESVATTKRFQQAQQHAAGTHLGFAVVDLARLKALLPSPEKGKDLGQALILGQLPARAYAAPWAAFTVDLDATRDGWRFQVEGLVPRGGETAGPLTESFGGKLENFPFALPKNTVGVIRMRRDIEAMWTHRDAVIAESGIPGLVQFEGTFKTLTGGMNWVEEFLPAFGNEITLVAAREDYEKGKTPTLNLPQFAFIGKLDTTDKLALQLNIAFQTVIGTVNTGRAQKGEKPFYQMPEIYKDVTIQCARYLPATDAEMMGAKGLPARFNFSPSLAVVDGYLVFASGPEIIKELIDGRDKPSGRHAGVNAGLWIDGPELYALGLANRENLIANSMVEDGKTRAQAELEIGYLLDIGRHLRSLALTVVEEEGTHGFRFSLELQAEATGLTAKED